MSTKAIREALAWIERHEADPNHAARVLAREAMREVEEIEAAARVYVRDDRGLGEMLSFDQLMAAIARQSEEKNG